MGVGRIWRPWARYILLALTYMGVYENFGVYVIDVLPQITPGETHHV